MPTTVRVSATARKAHPTILSALLALNDVQGRAVVVIDPGVYNEGFVVGTEVELRAADGPGTVTITAANPVTIESSGRLTLVDLKIVNRDECAVKATGGAMILERCDIWGYGKASVQALAGTELVMTDCDAHIGRCSMTSAKGRLTGCRFHDATDNAVAAVDGSEAEIRDCVVSRTGLLGIRVHSSTATIDRCDITGTGDAAISVDTHGSATITDCRVNDVHSIGIQFNQGTGSLTDTAITGAKTGLWVTNSARPVVRRCVIEDCRDAGVLVAEKSSGEYSDIEIHRAVNAGFYVGTASNPVVSGLKVGTTAAGVLVTGSQGKFSDVRIWDAEAGIKLRDRGNADFTKARLTGCEYGVEVHGYSSAAALTDVRIEDIKAAGVFVGDDGRATLQDCVIQRTGGVGLNASGSRITVKDTEVLDTELGGAYVHGSGSLVAERLSVLGSRGYGLWAKDKAWLDVKASVFKDNEGDGVLASDQSSGRVAECTITGNGRDVVAESNVRVDSVEPRREEVQPEIVTESAALAELEELIGLEAVKKQVRTQVNLIRVAQQRVKAGLPAPGTSRHLIFSGPPGTGKTTVARLYGQILAALGVLAKGQVVEVSRSDLVGQYLGSTALKTKAVFETAVGGVLFIDEAFALSRIFGANADFGQEAIDELVKLMEDRRADVVVIAAGYTDEMKTFLDTNPGLKSRFSRVIEFPPYSPEDLVNIFEHHARKNHYEIDERVRTLVLEHFEEQVGLGHLGNARDARTMLEAMLERQAERLAVVDAPTREQLLWLLPVDFPEY
jgi:hypothetical protein